jgi:hypothetical protein
MLGRPLYRLYYHLRLLEYGGLVIARNLTPGVGRRDTDFDVPGRPIYLKYDLRNAANQRAVAATVRSIWRATQTDFARGLNDPKSVVSGSARNLWAGRAQARLSPGELAEINRHVQEIIHIMTRAREPHVAKRTLQFTFALSPCEPA